MAQKNKNNYMLYSTQKIDQILFPSKEPIKDIKQEIIESFNINSKITTLTKAQTREYKEILNAHLDHYEEAIKEIAPMLEYDLKDKYPEFNITRELINCSIDAYPFEEKLNNYCFRTHLVTRAAIWLTDYILSDPEKKKKAEEILKNVNCQTYNVIPIRPIDCNISSIIDIKIQKIIFDRKVQEIRQETGSEKLTIPALANNYMITNRMYNNQLPAETPEYKKFEEILALIDEKTILNLKEDYYNLLKEYLELYLQVKQDEIKDKTEKVEKNKKELFEINETIGRIINVAPSLNPNYIIQKDDIINYKPETKEKIKNFKIKKELINGLPFIIFYMFEKQEPMAWLIHLNIGFLKLVNQYSDLITFISPSLGYHSNILRYKDYDFNLQPEHQHIAAIKCINPDAKIDDLKFKITYNLDSKYHIPEFYITFKQYLHSITNCINSIKTDNKAVIKQKELFMKGGIEENKAELLSLLISNAASLVKNKYNFIEQYTKFKPKTDNSTEIASKLAKKDEEIKKLIETLNTSQKNFDQIEKICKKAEENHKKLKENEQKIIKIYTDKITNLETKTNKYEKENKLLTEKNETLNQKNKILNQKLDQYKMLVKSGDEEKARLLANEYISQYFQDQFEEAINEQTNPQIHLPYINTLKTTVFGGHPGWIKQMQELAPNVVYFPKDRPIDEQLLKNSEIIWIQPNALSHCYYYDITKIAKNNNISLNFFSSSSAKRCAEQIAVREQQLTDRKEEITDDPI